MEFHDNFGKIWQKNDKNSWKNQWLSKKKNRWNFIKKYVKFHENNSLIFFRFFFRVISPIYLWNFAIFSVKFHRFFFVKYLRFFREITPFFSRNITNFSVKFYKFYKFHCLFSRKISPIFPWNSTDSFSWNLSDFFHTIFTKCSSIKFHCFFREIIDHFYM